MRPFSLPADPRLQCPRLLLHGQAQPLRQWSLLQVLLCCLRRIHQMVPVPNLWESALGSVCPLASFFLPFFSSTTANCENTINKFKVVPTRQRRASIQPVWNQDLF